MVKRAKKDGINIRLRRKLQASREFTDREEPRKAFWNNYEKVKKSMLDGGEDTEVRVVSYYGFGGIGKTSLLKKLLNEIEQNEDKPKVVKHDFEDSSESLMVLKSIRVKLEESYNFEFPFFDIGLHTYWKKCGINSEEPAVKSYIDNHPKVKTLVEGMGLFVGLADAAQLLKAIEAHINRIRSDVKRKRYREYLEYLEEIENTTELTDYLVDLFILDLTDNLTNEKKPLIIMFDTYEKLVNEMSDKGNPLGADKWIRGENGLINSVPGVLWVIAGREKLKWERYDETWKDTLEQHLLGKLDENDAFDFLGDVKIEDVELRRKLCKLTDCIPVYLDLCIQKYFEIKHEGKTPTIDDFGKTSEDLVTRYVRDMEGDIKLIVYVLSALQKWNDDFALQILSKTLSSFREDLYGTVMGFSIVNEVSFGENSIYNIHQVVRDVFYEDFKANSNNEQIWKKVRTCAIDFCLDKTKEIDVFSSDYAFYLERLMQYALQFYENDEELKDFYLKNIDGKLKELSKYGRKTLVNSVFHDFFERAKSSKNEMFKTEAHYSFSKFLDEAGNHLEALNIIEKVIVSFEKLLSADDDRVFSARCSEIIYLLNNKNVQEAYDKSLRLEEDFLDSNNKNWNVFYEVLDVKFVALYQLEKFEEMEHAARTVIEFFDNELGKDNDFSISFEEKLAIALGCQESREKIEEAINLQKQHLEWLSQKSGENSWDALNATNNLAGLYLQAGNITECLKLSKKIVKMQTNLYGEDNSSSVKYMNNLAISLCETKNPDNCKEALKWGERALKIQQKHKEYDSSETIRIMNNLVSVYEVLNRDDDKFDMQNKLIQYCKETFGETHEETAFAMFKMAAMCSEAAKFIEAIPWYKKAAECGNKKAQYELSHIYFEGIGTDVDYDEAFEWALQAAEGEDADVRAMSLLGAFYAREIGTDRNMEEAIMWLKKAAKLGDATAQLNLGNIYLHEKELGVSPEDGINWIIKSAEQGNADAQLILANLYYAGNVVAEDKEKALSWYEKAAGQGEPEAQMRLGGMYINGEATDVDYEKGLSWITKSAEKGNVYAQLNLADWYYNGTLVEEDENEAFEWYSKAAGQGHPNALFMLGMMYMNGEGTEKDLEEGVRCVAKAAELGYADAQLYLASWYYSGEYVEEDKEEAFGWLLKAAEQGSSNAQFNLYVMYSNGEGVRQDGEEAMKWLKKAAEQGFEPAIKALGITEE